VVGILFLGFLYTAYLGAGKIMELDSLSVRTIKIEGCRVIRPDQIRSYAGVASGEPLLRVDLNEVRQKVISHPSVRNATVVRELPDTLRISIEERLPVAVVPGEGFALVDKEGTVLGMNAFYPEGYPLITGVTESLVPGKTCSSLLPAVEVLASLTRSGLIGAEQISEIRIKGPLIRTSLVGSGTELVTGPDNVDAQVMKLVRLMEAGVFDTLSAGYDLRFEGRVIGMPEGKLGI
jgi:cell division protein FtsQ